MREFIWPVGCGCLMLAVLAGHGTAHADSGTLAGELRARQAEARVQAAVEGAQRNRDAKSSEQVRPMNALQREQRARRALELRQTQRAQRFDTRKQLRSNSNARSQRSYLRHNFQLERRAQELQFKLNRR